jgi:RNA polymerase sigma factor (sigma-70 family)
MSLAKAKRDAGPLCGQDHGAVEQLVRRHGRLVYGTCRRIAGNRSDAADAFRAVFLVLAPPTGRLERRKAAETWLHRVTCRAAGKLRPRPSRGAGASAKRPVRPRTYTVDSAWEQVEPILDAELLRLPSRHRRVIVLCDLSQRAQEEAARRLDLSLESVRRRLWRARRALRDRLARRGVDLSNGLTAVLLSEKASPPIPTELISSTVKACADLRAGGPASPPSTGAIAAARRIAPAMQMAKAKALAAILVATVALTACTALAVLQAVRN